MGTKGFTVYLTKEERRMLDVIGEATDRRAGRVARRYIRLGIRRWLRKAGQVPAGAH